MKIEVELEDSVYQALKNIFGEQFDLSAFMSKLSQIIVVLLATHPQDFREAFGEEAKDRLPPSVREAYQKLEDKFIKREI